MEAIAKSRYQRISSRKIGQVLDLIRGKQVSEAENMLRFIPKSAAGYVSKTLHSAAANLGKNVNMDKVFVKSAWVTVGPLLKRINAGPHGRAIPYTRKSCHITIVVSS